MPSYSLDIEGPAGSSGGVGGSFNGPDAAIDSVIRDIQESPFSGGGDYTIRVFELDGRDRRVSDVPVSRTVRIAK